MSEAAPLSFLTIVRVLLTRQLLPWLTVLMETLWVYPWMLFATRWETLSWDNPPLSLGSAVALALAAQVTSALGLAGNWTLNTVRTMVLPALAFLLFCITLLEIGSGLAFWTGQWVEHTGKHVSALLGGLGFGVLFMWRGISVGRDPTLFDGLYGRFTIGLISLIFLGLLWGAVATEGELRRIFSTIGVYVLGFFATGLLAMGVSNLYLIGGRVRRTGESFNLFDRRWIVTLIGAVLVIALVALGLASAFSLQAVEFVAGLLGTAANAVVTAVLYAIIFPITYLSSGLIWLVDFLLGWIGGSGGTPPPPDLTLFQEIETAASDNPERGFPRAAALAIRWGLVALGIAIAVALLAFALFRRRRAAQETEDVEEYSEYFWTWSALKRDLFAILNALLRRFLRRRSPPAPLASPPPSALVLEDSTHVFSIQEIYRGLLWEGRVAGVGRLASETPYEYGQRIAPYSEPATDELDAITQAYVSARYGEQPIVGQRLADLNRLWHRLRNALRTPPGSRRPRTDETPG